MNIKKRLSFYGYIKYCTQVQYFIYYRLFYNFIFIIYTTNVTIETDNPNEYN